MTAARGKGLVTPLAARSFVDVQKLTPVAPCR